MLNENEVLDIMKNDLYQANERIRELETLIKNMEIAFNEASNSVNSLSKAFDALSVAMEKENVSR